MSASARGNLTSFSWASSTVYGGTVSKLLAPIVYFAKPIKTSLWVIWTEQHVQYTLFLLHTRQEENECTIKVEKI